MAALEGFTLILFFAIAIAIAFAITSTLFVTVATRVPQPPQQVMS